MSYKNINSKICDINFREGDKPIYMQNKKNDKYFSIQKEIDLLSFVHHARVHFILLFSIPSDILFEWRLSYKIITNKEECENLTKKTHTILQNFGNLRQSLLKLSYEYMCQRRKCLQHVQFHT